MYDLLALLSKWARWCHFSMNLEARYLEIILTACGKTCRSRRRKAISMTHRACADKQSKYKEIEEASRRWHQDHGSVEGTVTVLPQCLIHGGVLRLLIKKHSENSRKALMFNCLKQKKVSKGCKKSSVLTFQEDLISLSKWQSRLTKPCSVFTSST